VYTCKLENFFSVKANGETEYELLRDSRTRWNSLFFMLERFYQMKSYINVALEEVQFEIEFSQLEYNTIQILYQTLSPLEECVKQICRQDCSLYEAHVAVEVVIEELNKLSSSISIELKGRLVEEVTSRMSDSYQIQLYLIQPPKQTIPLERQINS